MTRETAEELIDRMPYLPAYTVKQDKIRMDLYRQALEGNDPLAWVKTVKTHHIRQTDRILRQRPSGEETKLAEEVRAKLHREIGAAFGLPPDQVETFIETKIQQAMDEF